MAVYYPMSWLLTSVLFLFELSTVHFQRGSLSVVYANAVEQPLPLLDGSRDGCITRCNQGRIRQQALQCRKRCSSLQKRSVGAECDYSNDDVWPIDGSTPRGIAQVCVEYKLDKSGGYERVNVSWAIPEVSDLKNESNKYADVDGFFVRWAIGNQLNEECRMFPKNVSYFILNSSSLPPEKMKCNIPLSFLVHILPLPMAGSADLQPYNCSANTRKRECFHWSYKAVAHTYATVVDSTSSSQMNTMPLEITTTSSPHSPQVGKGKRDRPEIKVACGTDNCIYAVSLSVASAIILLVVLLIFLVKSKRICSPSLGNTGILDGNFITNTNKDYCYVSYFDENSKSGNTYKAVLDHLMRSGLRTVAVNALADQADLANYYALGPRKFSELYMQNARYVIVLVTKKYLELCNVKNNAELDGERRRVFEEIKYIDRAQLEVPCSLVPITIEENGNVLLEKYSRTMNGEMTVSFENNHLKETRFVALILESGLKLPTWMKGWPVHKWPQDEAALLKCIAMKM